MFGDYFTPYCVVGETDEDGDFHKLDTTYMTDGALRVDADPADVDFDALTIAVFDSHNELLGEVYD